MKYLKFLSLFAFAALMFPFSGQAQTAEVAEVSPIRAKLMARNGALMIDVREADEVAELAYDSENVINIPLSEFESRMSEIPKDKELIMACRSGNRSRKAAAILMKNGYENPLNLKGGIKAWQAKDLAVVKNGKQVESSKKACCAKGSGKNAGDKASCDKSGKASKKGCCSSKNKAGKGCGSKAKVGTK